ncbi:MAG: hypothetical protein NTX52_12550 [Planctomycetota bacterium]|nr:hypothetical protein [Planctomycetota bacterium]
MALNRRDFVIRGLAAAAAGHLISTQVVGMEAEILSNQIFAAEKLYISAGRGVNKT